MPEPALPRLDPERRERLAALGLELLALRAELAQPASETATRSSFRLVLAGAEWPCAAPLLRGIVAALGLADDAVTSQPQPGRPTLRIGAAAADETPDGLALPPLAALRDARVKRELWPRLRRLRRRLEQERPA